MTFYAFTITFLLGLTVGILYMTIIQEHHSKKEAIEDAKAKHPVGKHPDTLLDNIPDLIEG